MHCLNLRIRVNEGKFISNQPKTGQCMNRILALEN